MATSTNEKINGYKKIDREIVSIIKKFPQVNPAPNNVDVEKKRFFEALEDGKKYNPQFTYDPLDIEKIDKLKEKLVAIKIDSSPLGKIFRETKKGYLLRYRILKSIGKKNFTKNCIKTFGLPDRILLTHAKHLINIPRLEQKKKYKTKQVIKMFKRAFIKYGIEWDIEEKDMISIAAVDTTNKKLLIKKNREFTELFVKRLIVHEIGTHIVRYENGSQQPYKIFAHGLGGYLMTEEGLAVYNEEKNNCLTNDQLRIYSGRVLAINKALKSSFYETYKLLNEHFSPALSWRLALRSKRGLSDTSERGAYTKDIAYLSGYINVKEFIKKEPEGSDIKLYYGKVGIQHTKYLDSIPGLVNPHLLPIFRYYDFFKSHFSRIIGSIIFLDFVPKMADYLDKKLKE